MTVKNSKGEPFSLVETYREGNRTYGVVHFLDTGTVDVFRLDQIKSGSIKDRYAKNVLGVACIGDVKKVDHTQEYEVWKSMLSRCYNKNDAHYKNYGGKGVFVSDEWLCFEHFLKDITEIDRYNEIEFREGKLQIDKDLKQIGVDKKCYSKETCTFLSPEENSRIAERKGATRVRAYGRNVDGKEFYITDVQKFSKEHKLNKNHVYSCINNNRTQHKGWTFRKAS